MSQTIFEEKGELPSVTIFYGGKKRGRCIQLTHKETKTANEFVHSYITISANKIPALIKLLEKTMKKLKETK